LLQKTLQACIIRAELKGTVQEVRAERLEAVGHRQQFQQMRLVDSDRHNLYLKQQQLHSLQTNSRIPR
jgi:hypothetical protein